MEIEENPEWYHEVTGYFGLAREDSLILVKWTPKSQLSREFRRVEM